MPTGGVKKTPPEFTSCSIIVYFTVPDTPAVVVNLRRYFHTSCFGYSLNMQYAAGRDPQAVGIARAAAVIKYYARVDV